MDTAAALAPFAPVDRGIDEPDPVRAALRAAGPVVRVGAPAGGSVWIVTDEAVARAALVDPRITKDPAWAPTAWDPQVAGLEPPAAAQPSLTTFDGPSGARRAPPGPRAAVHGAPVARPSRPHDRAGPGAADGGGR
jgi:hypothetical protein